MVVPSHFSVVNFFPTQNLCCDAKFKFMLYCYIPPIIKKIPFCVSSLPENAKILSTNPILVSYQFTYVPTYVGCA